MNLETQKAIKHLSKSDKVLSNLIKNYGICKIEPHKKYFFDLLRAIMGQQLSIKAAASIEKKFMAFFNNLPTPEKILNTKNEALRAVGLSNSKVKYIKDLAEKVFYREISLNRISTKSEDEIIAELTKVKGIGIWTVHMFLIFTLGRLNVLPYTDFGIRKAVMLNYGLKKLPDKEKIIGIAKENNWNPYCSIASIYLWKSLNNN